MWRSYLSPVSVEEVIHALAKNDGRARVVAGATDLMLELERGLRRGIDWLIDISRIDGLNTIEMDEKGWIHLGAMVTHNDCVSSALIRDYAFPLAQAAWEVGSPQIRNRGTIAGNIITGSPANDTITPLMALGAEVVLRSARGERVVSLDTFYTGVRKTVMEPDEMMTEIRFRAMDICQRGVFIKHALRRAQAISIVNVAAILCMDGDTIVDAKITLGAVTPIICRAYAAENYLRGKSLTSENITRAARLAVEAAKPISDIRGSAIYRTYLVEVLTRRALMKIMNAKEREGFPNQPVTLRKPGIFFGNCASKSSSHTGIEPIITRINGKEYVISDGFNKSLLELIRDQTGLTGTKEGCAEGECGACTVILDGQAVMSCLVPAPRAHGADIITVEGLASPERLHPIQEAFIHSGAVQCGYCTPGFLVSSATLLEEVLTPSQEQIRQALTGNLCRCTGYYQIIQAVESASRR